MELYIFLHIILILYFIFYFGYYTFLDIAPSFNLFHSFQTSAYVTLLIY